MKNHQLLALASVVAFFSTIFLSSASAQKNPTVRLDFQGGFAEDILRHYQLLSNRPVYLSLDVQARLRKMPRIDLQAHAVPLAEALTLIRKALSESCGIEIRDSGTGEILVSEPASAKDKPAATPVQPPT